MSTWQQTQTPYGSGAGLFILILIHFLRYRIIFQYKLNCQYGDISRVKSKKNINSYYSFRI